jgi:hypothetical protein
MKSNNNNNNDDDDNDDDDDNNNTAMGSVHARGDTFLTLGLKALTESNTSRLDSLQYLRPHVKVKLISHNNGNAFADRYSVGGIITIICY